MNDKNLFTKSLEKNRRGEVLVEEEENSIWVLDE